jgi:NADPH:quinone reductase-like Zn-dependent oxidoreductase
VQLAPILMQNLRIQGVIVGHREAMEAMNQAVAVAQLAPVLDAQSFPLAEAGAALRYLQSGEHFGKVVIQIQ